MQSLGELATLYPTTGAFTEMAGRFIDPAVAVALGWNYWYLVSMGKSPPEKDQPFYLEGPTTNSFPQWASNIAAEYNLVSIVLSYWTDKVPTYGWILMCWAFYQCIAFLGVIVYGELEFWLAIWKVLCIFVGFLLAILVNTGAIGGDYIGFRYWKEPGPIVHGINGFGQSFVLAAVYYCGTELVAITAGESKNPSRDVPKVRPVSKCTIGFTKWNRQFDKPSSVSYSSSLAWSFLPELLFRPILLKF